MRHFLGYKSDGTFGSIETHGGGWPECKCQPDCKCLADDNCVNSVCSSLRENRARNNPELIGYYLYDCACPAAAENCSCYNEFLPGHYLDIPSLTAVEKVDVDVLLGGVVVENMAIYDAPPGTAVSMQVVGDQLPDNSIVDVFIISSVDITKGDKQLQLAAMSGQTTPIVLTAPAQGARGTFIVQGKYIKSQRVSLRGWN